MYSVGEPPITDHGQPSMLIAKCKWIFFICIKKKRYKYLDKYFYKMRFV
jgi:hypothetical protein